MKLTLISEGYTSLSFFKIGSYSSLYIVLELYAAGTAEVKKFTNWDFRRTYNIDESYCASLITAQLMPNMISIPQCS